MDPEALIAAVLRGERIAWPAGGAGEEDLLANRLLERSAYHGVQALLHHFLSQACGAELGWPGGLLDALRTQALAQAMWELRHRKLLEAVMARLLDVGIQPIFLKGTAMAYDVYPTPFLRVRGDTDLLVAASLRDRAIEALEALGFVRIPAFRGKWLTCEASFAWRDPAAKQTHLLDLHWEINNSPLLRRLFAYDELLAQAQPLPALCPGALAVSRVHGLLIACMHRAVHKQSPYFVNEVSYRGGDRFIWFYDIALLLGRLEPPRASALMDLAEPKGLGKTCREGIERAQALFGMGSPKFAFGPPREERTPAPADRYLDGSAFYQLLADFRAVPGLRHKLRFLADLFLPPVDHMRRKYPGAKPGWLSWLYLRRAGEGLWSNLFSGNR